MTRPTLAAIASTAAAAFVGYHCVRRRHDLRTLAWALTGHPADEADPTTCDGDQVVAYLRRKS